MWQTAMGKPYLAGQISLAFTHPQPCKECHLDAVSDYGSYAVYTGHSPTCLLMNQLHALSIFHPNFLCL